jgi:RNA 3'-terminal phosphate cyclase (ATP)
MDVFGAFSEFGGELKSEVSFAPFLHFHMVDYLLDGSQGEGGGQILRTALALSACRGLPFRIARIRAGRDRPGLRPQHLAAVRALARVTGAEVEGDRVGSTDLAFRPGPVRAGAYQFEVGTAGSVSLILQTLVLPLAFQPADSEIVLGGGTHVPWSPPIDYVRVQWLPRLAAMGVAAELEVSRAGYYPAGGGWIRCAIRGRGAGPLRPIVLDSPGPVEAIGLRAVVSNLPLQIPERMIARARGRLRAILADAAVPNAAVRDETAVLEADGPGVMVMVDGRGPGAFGAYAALGAKGKRSERVADEACDAFARFLAAGATVDEFAADQLLLPCAFAAGPSVFRTPDVTRHLLTNAGVLRQILGVRVEIEGGEGEAGRVTVG